MMVQCENRKILPGAWQQWIKCTFLAQKIKMLFQMEHPSWAPTLVYMSAGVFIDHKSSNRIKLSWLVKDLLHFYWFGPQGVGICRHAPHACCTHTCTHVKRYMLRNCKWLTSWYHVQHVCACMCMCVCMHEGSHTPTCPPTPRPVGVSNH